MAFLDGMHEYEFLLRDFINVEKHCEKDSVVLMHDCLPSDEHVARRNPADMSLADLSPHPDWWAGDVWKAAAIIRQLRPDLVMFGITTPPTGLIAITNLDPNSEVLQSQYSEAIRMFDENTCPESFIAEFANSMPLFPPERLTSAFAVLGRLSGDAAPPQAEVEEAEIPKDATGLTKAAVAAVAERDLARALTISSDLIQRHPSHADGYIVKARTLRDLQRFEEAERFISEAPSDIARRIELRDVIIWCAAYRNDWQRVLDLSTELIGEAPAWSEGYVHGARALMRLGRVAGAEALIAQGYEMAPGHPGILLERARSATLRRDWPEAVRRWTSATELFPNFAEIREGFSEAKMLAALEDVEHEHRSITPGSSGGERGSATATGAARRDPALFSHFESLGDNCEFGIVQRLGGVEPLGLLRWATIYPQNLLTCLQTRFEGIGELSNTEIIRQSEEWSVVDKRYFSMHTFVRVDQNDPETFRRKMARRLVFLRNKLIEDLSDAEKVFVYKTSDGLLEFDVMELIFEALQVYGPVRLLCVRKPLDSHVNLDMELLRDRLAVGYLSHMSKDPLKARGYFDEWTTICRKAADSFHMTY